MDTPKRNCFLMRLRACWLLTLVLGCTTLPREPYLWRDDSQPVGVHRADVARAEGRVIEYLAARGILGPEEISCGRSPRAYNVLTTETETAFEVRVSYRPGLCYQAPEDTTLPPVSIFEHWPFEYAVSKKDFHIMRTRFPGDDHVEMVLKPTYDSDEDLPPEIRVELAKIKKQPPPAIALAFTTPSSSIPVGVCAGPVSVETRTSSGSPQAVTKTVAINWAATPPSAVFFSDAKCATALTSTDVSAGSSKAEIYFRATQLGPLQMTISAIGFTSADQTYTVEAARPVAVAFTSPPQTVAKGTCSSAVTVQALDAFGNPASIAAATPVELLSTPAGGVKFFERPDCTGAAITRASLPASGSSASFYFKGRRAGTVVITATLGAGSASQDAVIGP
jgi:hypothetical protein